MKQDILFSYAFRGQNLEAQPFNMYNSRSFVNFGLDFIVIKLLNSPSTITVDMHLHEEIPKEILYPKRVITWDFEFTHNLYSQYFKVPAPKIISLNDITSLIFGKTARRDVLSFYGLLNNNSFEEERALKRYYSKIINKTQEDSQDRQTVIQIYKKYIHAYDGLYKLYQNKIPDIDRKIHNKSIITHKINNTKIRMDTPLLEKTYDILSKYKSVYKPFIDSETSTSEASLKFMKGHNNKIHPYYYLLYKGKFKSLFSNLFNSYENKYISPKVTLYGGGDRRFTSPYFSFKKFLKIRNYKLPQELYMDIMKLSPSEFVKKNTFLTLPSLVLASRFIFLPQTSSDKLVSMDFKHFYLSIISSVFKEKILSYEDFQKATGIKSLSQAKRIYIGILFGMGAKSISEELNNCSVLKATELIHKLHEKYPRFNSYKLTLSKTLKQSGNFYNGETFNNFYKDIIVSNFKSFVKTPKGLKETNPNKLIQNKISTIGNAILIEKIEQLMDIKNISVHLPIHDEILFSMPKNKKVDLLVKKITSKNKILKNLDLQLKTKELTRWQ